MPDYILEGHLIRRLARSPMDPVMQDDQHRTAVVVLAGLRNALKLVKKQLDRIKIVIVGSGPAGTATARILYSAGARNMVICHRKGILEPSQFQVLGEMQKWLLQRTNPSTFAAPFLGPLRKRTSSPVSPSQECRPGV